MVRIKRKGEKFERNTVFPHIIVSVPRSIAILTKSPWDTYKEMIKDHISLKFCALYVPQPLEISCFIYETLEIVVRVKVSTIVCTSPKNNIAWGRRGMEVNSRLTKLQVFYTCNFFSLLVSD